METNSLYQALKKQRTAVENHWKKDKKIKAEIEALEEKRKRLRYPHLTDLLEKLGKQLLPHFPGAVRVEVLGPFGLGNETSLYISAAPKKGVTDGKTLGSITFTRSGEGYAIKDYSKKHKTYAPGSIGELNGSNYGRIELNETHTIEWMVKHMKKGRSK